MSRLGATGWWFVGFLSGLLAAIFAAIVAIAATVKL